MKSRTLIVMLTSASACTTSSGDYYENNIAPILTARCTQSRSGACHTDDGTGRAQGNLDLSSYEAVTRRPDVLRRFGSYPMPLLLLKAVADPPAVQVPINVGDGVSISSQVRHAGGALLAIDDSSFQKLDEWLQNGATRTGEPPPPLDYDPGPCSPVIRPDLFPQQELDDIDTGSEQYQMFQNEVWPIIKDGCLGRECHGARDTHHLPTIELYYTCGDDEQQQRFNYLMSRTYSGADGRGQLTQKPLKGASFHIGGKPFDIDDRDYRVMVEWSAMDPPLELQYYEGSEFFDANVQPVLVAKGCYFEACHSLSNFNFYKPLAGTDGHYGTRVKLHNYLMARFQLGLESSDPDQGRLIKKNLMAEAEGMPHRGGPLLVPRGACDLTVDEVRADPKREWFREFSPVCIIQTWHRLERAIAVENGQLTANPGAVGVFVRRPANSDRHIDFDNYRPGADLLQMNLALDADGRVTGMNGEPQSLLGLCGVDPADADVRRPDISGDGNKIIFAMRTSQAEGLGIYEIDLGVDPQTCTKLDLPEGTDSTGTPIHHFDPAYAPGRLLLFASTMGDPEHADPDRQYPSRTLKHFLPNSNIWVYAFAGSPRRLSYLSNAELAPRLLHSREVIYGVEKAAPDFYQISTRAIRLDDGGGYRPQLGQRPKMGYGQVTEMRELVDFRTVFIASDPGTYFGGGTLGIQDITLGLEELAFDDKFLHPTRILDPVAASRPGEVGTGVYRSPTAMPDGRILVAYSPGEVDLGNPDASVDYGLYVVDPSGVEAPWLLYDSEGQHDIEPVLAFKRVFVPQPARIHQNDPDRGEYVFHSFPLFAVMLNDNTRQGSQPNNEVVKVRILEQMSPPEGVTSAEEVAQDLHGEQKAYIKRRLIGEIPLLSDGSARFMIPASTPVVFELLDAQGNVIDWQREEEQLGPGETEPRMIPVREFNGICGGCHNAIDGSELGVAPGPDILTGASTHSEASQSKAIDLYVDPAERQTAPFSFP